MTTTDWMQIPPKIVFLPDLVPTQAIAPLYSYDTSECGDPAPHLVRWKGTLYINDGHHRIARWIRTGKGYGLARIVET